MKGAALVFAGFFAFAPLLWAQAPAPEGDDALRARLPKDCDKHKAKDPPKIRRSDPLPSARSIVESYGSLGGPLADFLRSLGEVDLVFDTELCERREWDGTASGVEFEVVEYLLCGEVVEVELRHSAPVDPLAGLLDAGVARVTYSTPDAPPVVVTTPEDLKELLFLLHTRSLNNAVQDANRPLRDPSGFVRRSEVSESSPGAESPSELRLTLRDGKEKVFHGHARSGEFAGFSNTDLYPFLERLARRLGQAPPKE